MSIHKSSIQYLKGIGPKRLKLLEKLGISTISDLLLYLPMRYEDRSNLKHISKLEIGTLETFKGQIVALGASKTKNGKKIFEIIIADMTGTVNAKWFNYYQNYIKKFKHGDQVILSGTVQYNRSLHQKEVYHPDIEKMEDETQEFLHIGRIVPVYPSTEGLHQKSIRAIIKSAVDSFSDSLEDCIPENLRRKKNLCSIHEAVYKTHFPDNDTSVNLLNSFKTKEQLRLIYEEFLMLEVGLALKKKNIVKVKKGVSLIYKKDTLNDFAKSLPFKLTNAQTRCAKEILGDLIKSTPMNRLLQGDVGSGKTVVALIALILVVANGHQAAFMVPTEILAEQHYEKIIKFISNFKSFISTGIVLLTSSTKPKERKKILEDLKNGIANIVIGTHSLIQNDVTFKSLGLAIIDEQHKFGVMQRSDLKGKGNNPDILFMTATPIPRTLSMTVYGDLDVTIIDELPKGRKQIKTFIYYEKNLAYAYEIVRNEIKKGRQAYIIYPLVEESEKVDLKSAISMMEHLQRDIFSDLRLGMVHGRLKIKEKEDVMKRFYKGELDILISTTVVEVGVDVPNASCMLIEHAERFGLAQLHQLRGRIGRGEFQSYCILLPSNQVSDDGKKRLAVMKGSTDGFYIAEKDLEIRGPGEFLGTRQSGLPELKIANIIRDAKLLTDIRKTAFELVDSDPDLLKEENQLLKKAVIEKWQKKLKFFSV